MKKLLALLLILAVTMSAVAIAEYPLSENEQKYVGAWNMYIDNGEGTVYVFITTFLDNYQVIQRSMTFKNGVQTSDNKATGSWSGFTEDSILFTLAGTGMAATIKDDGFLYMYFFEDMKLCGIFASCPDMREKLGW